MAPQAGDDQAAQDRASQATDVHSVQHDAASITKEDIDDASYR